MYELKDLGWLERQWKERQKKGATEDQIPKALKGKAVLSPFLSFYYNSFWELCTDRRQDGYIPWTAIRKYCEVWGIVDPAEFDSFLRIIRAIDKAYVDHMQKEREKNLKS